MNPKPRQLFFGRFAVMAVVSLAQSTVMALGNLFFLDVQVTSPWLFMVCFWGAGLVFTFIIYALVVSFANLGKAIAVLLLIVQVTGCGGSFTLQIMPDFVQALSPLASRHPRGERHAKRHDGHLRRRLLGSDGRTRPVPHPGGALGPGAPQAPREVHGMVRGKGGELEAHQLARAARPKRPPFLILPFLAVNATSTPKWQAKCQLKGEMVEKTLVCRRKIDHFGG